MESFGKTFLRNIRTGHILKKKTFVCTKRQRHKNISVKIHVNAFVYSWDCVAGNSVGLHISLHVRHGDLAAMETLLAGDWLWASTHRPGLHSYRDTLKIQTLKAPNNPQESHKHSVASVPLKKYRLHTQMSVNRMSQAAVKVSHVTFNWPLECFHVLAAQTAQWVKLLRCFTNVNLYLVLETCAATRWSCPSLLSRRSVSLKSKPRKACRSTLSSMRNAITFQYSCAFPTCRGFLVP